MKTEANIPDDLNPNFIFNGVNTSLLTDIMKGNIDIFVSVKKELANRGLDDNGLWIGFEKAEDFWFK